MISLETMNGSGSVVRFCNDALPSAPGLGLSFEFIIHLVCSASDSLVRLCDATEVTHSEWCEKLYSARVSKLVLGWLRCLPRVSAPELVFYIETDSDYFDAPYRTPVEERMMRQWFETIIFMTL